MLNIFKVIFVIIGTIIGAGFASGQEVLIFFNKYGSCGFVGIIISSGLIGYVIYKTLKINLEQNIKTYQQFIETIIPNKFKKNKIVVFAINNIINIFLFTSFNIMVAGFSTFLLQEFFVPRILGSVIISMISYFFFSKGISEIVRLNIIFIPIIILLIMFLGVIEIREIKFITTNKTIYWCISSVLYASYNSVCLIPILINLNKYIKSKKDAILISIVTFLIILGLLATIYFIMNLNFSKVINIEIPIVFIASKLGIISKYIYSMGILIAIFTTAISSGYGFLKNICLSYKIYGKCVAIICLISILFGQLGFANLISFLYPVFGCLGMVQIIFLLTA